MIADCESDIHFHPQSLYDILEKEFNTKSKNLSIQNSKNRRYAENKIFTKFDNVRNIEFSSTNDLISNKPKNVLDEKYELKYKVLNVNDLFK